MKLSNFVIALCVLLLLTSCERGLLDRDVEEKTLSFSSMLNGESTQDMAVKAHETTWSAGDKIGIFMKPAGSGLSSSIFSNSLYVTKNGDGIFVASDNSQGIKYPEDGSSVDFIAYYPYQQSAINGKYQISLISQQDQEAIDLIYSKNLTSVSKGNNNPKLAFSHSLAKLILNISPETENSVLSGLKVKITGMKTKAQFDLGTGGLVIDDNSVADIELKLSSVGLSSRAEAVLLPMADISAGTIVFTLSSGETFTYKFKSGEEFKSGYKHLYNIKLKTGTIVVNPGSNNWFEIPTISSTMENTVFVKHLMSELSPSATGGETKRNYSILYDTKNRVSYWVAYPLTSSDLGGSGRTDAWNFDPKVAPELQPNLRTGFGGGFDRGHQIPSADRTSSRSANATTFYYTNMTPQNSVLNQGLWAKLEAQVRAWIPGGDTLYVVTGAIPDNPPVWTNQNTEKAAVVPKYYFKALAKQKNGKYYTIGFRLNNEAPTVNNYNNYRVAVSAIEKESGFEIFPRIAKNIKETIDPTVW